MLHHVLLGYMLSFRIGCVLYVTSCNVGIHAQFSYWMCSLCYIMYCWDPCSSFVLDVFSMLHHVLLGSMLSFRIGCVLYVTSCNVGIHAQFSYCMCSLCYIMYCWDPCSVFVLGMFSMLHHVMLGSMLSFRIGCVLYVTSCIVGIHAQFSYWMCSLCYIMYCWDPCSVFVLDVFSMLHHVMLGSMLSFRIGCVLYVTSCIVGIHAQFSYWVCSLCYIMYCWDPCSVFVLGMFAMLHHVMLGSMLSFRIGYVLYVTSCNVGIHAQFSYWMCSLCYIMYCWDPCSVFVLGMFAMLHHVLLGSMLSFRIGYVRYVTSCNVGIHAQFSYWVCSLCYIM